MTEPIFIVGPTASGKSELALKLAERYGAEICSMDAFQVYRDLDIGTGKLAESERRGVRHHLLDIVDSLASFSVADYLLKAEEVLADLKARRKPVIWVGGTGLYYKALRNGLSPVPASDPELVREYSEYSLEALQQAIATADSVWAAKADLNNPRRIIRALVVARQTGRPLSEWHQIKGKGLLEKGESYFLQPSATWLRKKMEARIRGMEEAGWKDEVEKLLQLPGWEKSQSSKAIGYAQVISLLRGEMTKEEWLEEVSLKTWQYSRRQMTWFRAEEGMLLIDPEEGLESLLRTIDKKTKSQL